MITKVLRFLIPPLTSFLALLLLAWLLPSIQIDNLQTGIIVFLLLAIANSFIHPILTRWTMGLNMMTFGLLSFILNIVLVMLIDWLVPGFRMNHIWNAIAIIFVTSLVTSFATGLVYSKHDRQVREYGKLKRFARQIPNQGDATTPGFIFLEIDGLSYPILQRALKDGYMPNLAEWVNSGQYNVAQWDSGLPSQTSAMQAGILHGSHRDIPAFRWYDKKLKKLLVSGNGKDAAVMIKPVLNGKGILQGNGLSLNNWAYGDAPAAVMTFSTMSNKDQYGSAKQADNMYAFFANPNNMPTAIAGMVGDIFTELREARQQRKDNVLPRVHRGGVYPFMRAATVVMLPMISQDITVTKMFEGVDAVYTTLLSYDEIAHHSGIDRPDAFKILRKLDDQIAWVVAAGKETTRPYEFIILSDHGQSMGATFLQRYGMTLGDFVNSLLDQEHAAVSSVGGDNASGNVGLMLTKAIETPSVLARPVRSLLKKRTVDGQVEFDKSSEEKAAAESAKTVVCASGNLGLISFTEWPGRVSMEQMRETFPGFLDGLVGHEGVGFVLVHSDEFGGMVLGKQGVYYLATDKVEGENPLAVFGKHAVDHLRELDSYSNVPDVVVNSFYKPETNEVAAFEELVGSHGGLGGTQNQPFIMYPAKLEPAGGVPELIGAGSIYNLIKGWRAQLQGEPEAPKAAASEPELGAAQAPQVPALVSENNLPA